MGNNPQEKQGAVKLPSCPFCIALSAVLIVLAVVAAPLVVLKALLCLAYNKLFHGKETQTVDNQGCDNCGTTFLSDDQKKTPYFESYKRGCTPISAFKYESHIELIRLRTRLQCASPEQQYIVAKDFRVSFNLNRVSMCVVVPRGTLTDLSSIPWAVRWFVGRVGPHLEAAVVHDYMYIAWQIMDGGEAKPCYRDYADDLKFYAMWKAGMTFKARVIYCAVRLFGWCTFKEKNSGPLILCDKALCAINQNEDLMCPKISQRMS